MGWKAIRARWLTRRERPRTNRKRNTVASVSGRAEGAAFRRLGILGPALVWLLVAALAAVLAWTGGRQAFETLLAGNPAYRLRQVDIRSDGRQVTADRVRQWTGIEVGMNIHELDIGAIRTLLLEKVPVIREAQVRRILPDRLEIRISERIAVIGLGQHGSLGADAAGHVFSMAPAGEALPGVYGYLEPLTPGMRLKGRLFNAVEVADVCRRTALSGAIRMEWMDVRDGEWLTVKLREGPLVRLKWAGMERATPASRVALEAKLRSLARVLEDARIKNRRLRSVDLTFSDDYIPVE